MMMMMMMMRGAGRVVAFRWPPPTLARSAILWNLLVRNMDDESSQINYELYRAVDERWLESEREREREGGHKTVSITRRVDGACLVRGVCRRGGTGVVWVLR
uniref:Putative secreted protein n=1 Tax=Anopheles marajoara TaxID=58244 RepID=A0A2M4C9P2_9DIPT